MTRHRETPHGDSTERQPRGEEGGVKPYYEDESVTLASGYARGNPIITHDGRTWVYADGSPFDESRPCAKCGAVIPDVDLPDPCLGWLSGVAFACCGHGVPGEEYVKTEDGVLYESVAEWRTTHAAKEREHRYDPETCRCTCGALDHPDWGVTT